jgi:hypothetical protein
MSEKNRREFIKEITIGGVGIGLCGFSGAAAAVQKQWSDPRQVIPVAKGWRFHKILTPTHIGIAPAAPDYDDSSWEEVGVPHCYNDMDSFQNWPASETFQGTAWYRKRFRIDKSLKGKKLFLEFQGVNIGCAIYINGKFKPGNTAVPQPEQVTHVGDFLPFVLDITDDVHYGAPNVLAVRVCNIGNRAGYNHNTTTPTEVIGKAFYTDPGFGTYLDFGMGFGGIVCPVNLHVTNKVHVPFNSYSPLEKWGTYIATTSTSDSAAHIRIQTNVENEDSVPRKVTLWTFLKDPIGESVHAVGPETRTLQPGEIQMFDRTATLTNPFLWYPNNSPYGTPGLYSVGTFVLVDGETTDYVGGTLGVRTITWDADYCYVNGKKHLLNGFGLRNMYPALGSAVPADIQWNDIRLIAEAGGNALRVGHVPATIETVKACDAYGVLVIQNSGDNEWALKAEPAFTYKREYDRDMIIQFRNHPSIAVWEANNGLANYSPKNTIRAVDQWDYLQPRIVSSRDKSDYFPADRRLMIGFTNCYVKVPGSPSINMEVYGAVWHSISFCMARFDYVDEKVFADHYVTDYLSNIEHRACGWIDWMLAETQGESYTTYLNGMSKQKSLGSSAMDGNRFPKITYNIFKNALWVPFSTRPGVTLQSHWNLSGIQDVDAWSNCPAVELFLNDDSLGVRQTDAKKRCTWTGIRWAAGTLKATGLDAGGRPVCSDLRQTTGAPHQILLQVESHVMGTGSSEPPTAANGSDARIITATITDANGLWCPLADNNIRFAVEGPGSYRGSYNFYVTPGKPLTYHGPGDPNLQAEGGLMRIAVRSTFEPGVVHITAHADGLLPAGVSFITKPIESL